jgi:hypothetical protein
VKPIHVVWDIPEGHTHPRLQSWLTDQIWQNGMRHCEADGGWAPYLSLDAAHLLDDVREALRSGDLHRASQLASGVYKLTPVTA